MCSVSHCLGHFEFSFLVLTYCTIQFLVKSGSTWSTGPLSRSKIFDRSIEGTKSGSRLISVSTYLSELLDHHILSDGHAPVCCRRYSP